MLEDLIGTRGAYLLDQSLNILGKVPISELASTIKSLNSVFAVIFDGEIDNSIIEVADRSNVKYLVAMDSRADIDEYKVELLTNKDL